MKVQPLQTQGEIPMKIRPLHDRVIVRRLEEERQQLRAKKRRSQDLMFVANHGLVVSQANGHVGTDNVPGHGTSAPLS